MTQKTLHSKYASPTSLSMALTELVEDFTVELRQNVYNISSTKDFSMAELLESCERLTRLRSGNLRTNTVQRELLSQA
ncbi:hypothetical protein GGR58DRAFT_494899 [Xylaria digitata]|nr:hypothetical protein GGR58DRAFT_494899 [Xylaria digitata]